MMLILKIPGVFAAVLFMSSVSADVMELADRPGVTSGLSASRAILTMPTGDCLRRQINNQVILLPVQAAERKLSDLPRPVSLVPIRLSATLGNRPGRLSAEYGTVSRSHSKP